MEAEKIETQKRVKELRREAAGLAGRRRGKRRRQGPGEIDFLPFEQLPAEWPLFPEETCGGDEMAVEDLTRYSRLSLLKTFIWRCQDF